MRGPAWPGRARRRDLGRRVADLARPDEIARRRIGRCQHLPHGRSLDYPRGFVKLPVHPAPSPRPCAERL